MFWSLSVSEGLAADHEVGRREDARLSALAAAEGRPLKHDLDLARVRWNDSQELSASFCVRERVCVFSLACCFFTRIGGLSRSLST